MVKVLPKSHQEMLQEMWAAVAKFGPNYDFEQLSTAVVVTANGEKLGVRDLTETQILSFAEQNIAESTARNQEARQKGGRAEEIMEGIYETRNLLTAVQDHYQPSLPGMKKLISLYYHEDSDLRFTAFQALRGFLLYHTNYSEIIGTVQTAKAARGDEQPITKEELLTYLDGLLKNSTQEK